VVVPLCNESPNVRPLAEQILAAFAGERRGVEVVLVDDKSTDDTWEQILAVRRTDSRVRAVRHLRRGGQSAALWTGFGAARGEIIATLDGDLQNDPADLPRLVSELATCDMACGVRTRRQDNALRRISSKVARWARRVVLGVDFQDTGCNLRAFKRSVLGQLFPFNGLHRFMPILAHSGGSMVRELPVIHHARTAGLSKYGLWNRLGRGIFDLAAIAWYQRRLIAGIPAEEYTEKGS
jgi:dolichol-phosphate mannosyltransferase